MYVGTKKGWVKCRALSGQAGREACELRAARLLNNWALVGEVKEVSKPEKKLPSIRIRRESWVEEAGK
jgi:hypothetical protein